MKEENKIIMYDSEEAAKKVTITGWLSSKGRFYPDQLQNNEHLARYDGCTHGKCECGNIREIHYTICKNCVYKKEVENYLALPKQDWDGETPLYSESLDKYYFDFDSIEDDMTEENISIDDMRLVICKPIYASQIDENYWYDDLAEDEELPDELQKAVDQLNKVIKSLPPLSWYPGKVAAIIDIKDASE